MNWSVLASVMDTPFPHNLKNADSIPLQLVNFTIEHSPLLPIHLNIIILYVQHCGSRSWIKKIENVFTIIYNLISDQNSALHYRLRTKSDIFGLFSNFRFHVHLKLCGSAFPEIMHIVQLQG